MTHVFINEFKLRQRKLPLPNFLDLEKVKKHRSRAIESSREIEEILNQGHEIIGIDCEMFEFDQSKTTEIGIGRISKSGIRVEHIIISDYYNLRNSKRVPDNKNNFIYGSSTQMTLHDAELYVGQGEITNDLVHIINLNILKLSSIYNNESPEITSSR